MLRTITRMNDVWSLSGDQREPQAATNPARQRMQRGCGLVDLFSDLQSGQEQGWLAAVGSAIAIGWSEGRSPQHRANCSGPRPSLDTHCRTESAVSGRRRRNVRGRLLQPKRDRRYGRPPIDPLRVGTTSSDDPSLHRLRSLRHARSEHSHLGDELQQFWPRRSKAYGDHTVGSITLFDVGQSLLWSHRLPVGSCGEVAVCQRCRHERPLVLELGEVAVDPLSLASYPAAMSDEASEPVMSEITKMPRPSRGWKSVLTSSDTYPTS